MKIKTRLMALSILWFFLMPMAGTGAGELKFTTQEFAPFTYTEKGQAAGPGAEVIRLVCQQMKTGCKIRVYPWTRAQKCVEEGRANAMFLIGKNPERENWLWFSHPVLVTEYGFFVSADDPLEFRKTSDIKGYSVAVYGPSNTSRSLEKIRAEIGEIHIDMTPNDEPVFIKLMNRRVEAAYSNKDVGLALIKKHGLDRIRYAGRHKQLKYYIGFSKESTPKAVVDKFNAAFAELHQQGRIEKILSHYGMQTAPLK